MVPFSIPPVGSIEAGQGRITWAGAAALPPHAVTVNTVTAAASDPARRSWLLRALMRERVAALGGQLSTGPAPGGGYRVHATIPMGGS